MGPPPSHNARRRNLPADVRRLPPEGRQGDPPKFPLARPGKAVLALWAELWATPQAVAWEELGWTRVVARYTKLTLASEKRDAPVSLLGEVRQMEDRLGLTPMAMLRLRWAVEAGGQQATQEVPDDVAKLDEYRARLG